MREHLLVGRAQLMGDLRQTWEARLEQNSGNGRELGDSDSMLHCCERPFQKEVMIPEESLLNK